MFRNDIGIDAGSLTLSTIAASRPSFFRGICCCSSIEDVRKRKGYHHLLN
jgi:hypothetical protein